MDKRRGPIAAEFSGPGPAAISLPVLFGNPNVKESTKSKAPAYTMGGRISSKPFKNPSPNAYNTTGITARGKHSPPAPSLHMRLKDMSKFTTPAPGNYNPLAGEKKTKKAPASYSFGLRPDKGRSEGPAPNAYAVTTHKLGTDGPAFSLSARMKTEKVYVTPAPSTYEVKKPDLVRQKAPVYSLAGRFGVPSDKASLPGPGAYVPEKVNTRSNQPHYSFGMRHSHYEFAGKHGEDEH